MTHTRIILMCITSTCRSSKPDPGNSSGEDFSFQAPTHPWSVSNPRFLATPTASQPPTLTMHASAAAAPVGPGSASASYSIPPAQHMAMSQPASEANTAIPAIVPDAQDCGDLACPCSEAPDVFRGQWGLLTFCLCVMRVSSVSLSNAASWYECHILLKKRQHWCCNQQ